ncbi:TonB-dependent receptor [Candidatus Palauibacter soopunensis]|uniref:TonB-dependent receptor n=1 Tax=Candidatus Palauibacter soopunensis TaxID=3056739 RepID=UPI0023A04819|nr:TonB-dependent receptor [Candidatus Palauibacter soopunensis]MDE2878957.1 TonB-dependent receptor [Candidatus Palauibacter soopunensis]
MKTREAAAAAVWIWVSALIPAGLAAQEALRVMGSVREPAGGAIGGANVFLLETLEGALTDSLGVFSFESAVEGPVTLVVQRFGYLEVRRAIQLPLAAPVPIVMELAPVALEPIHVEAGTYRLGSLPDVILSDLDVVRTPGAAADPFRAIQTFPGLQNVGEGAGLFVRGGDISETRVMLDGATVISPFRLDTDRTVSFGRFDPFQLQGTHFSAGGFGVEYGDALSAVADLRSVGMPTRSELNLGASVAGVSGRAALDASESSGGWVTASRSDTHLLMRLNGRRSEFDQVPASTDLSGGAEWSYRGSGSMKAFGLYQTDRVGVLIDGPGHSGTYRSDARADLLAVSGFDAFGAFGVTWSVATSGSRKDEDFGAFRVEREDRLTQARAKLDVHVGRGIALAGGTEFEGRDADIAGAVPAGSHDNAPGAPTTVFGSRETGSRWGGFGEIELQPWNAVRFVVGARTDRSSFTDRVTADPRVSVSWRPAANLTVTGAWGVFHQIPDPLFFEPTLGDPSLPAMSARHLIGGIAYDDGEHLVRVEAYRKRYGSLASQTRDHIVRGAGTGEAAGFDIFLKGDVPFLGLTGRAAYSFVDSERTDPDSGELAPSPFDATHTLNIVLTRGLTEWLEVGAAWRAATGIPFTPVERALFDPDRSVWEPVYGAPMSERLPDYARFDLSASLLQSFWRENLTVFYVSVMNVFDRLNVAEYRHSRDYTDRTPLRSPFTRTIYFGATTTLPF